MRQQQFARALVVGFLISISPPVWAQGTKPGAKPPAKAPAKKPAAKKPAAKKPPAKAKPAPKPEPPDFRFLTEDLVVRKDGKLMWFYRTNHVTASNLGESLKKVKIPSLETITRDRWRQTFSYDMAKERTNLSAPPSGKKGPDENLLILVFPPPYKEMVEEFLDRFDIPEPQVFIKAKVVEVTLDSELDVGTSLVFNRSGGDPNNPQNTNAFFRGFNSTFKPDSFTQPNASGLTLFFDDLGEKYGTVQAQIHALQERGSANILSEPSIVAAQGQLATLVTGTQTPISQITVTGGSERISTEFKETGIKLNFRPLHIGREYVRLRARVEVSSVTGFLTTIGQNVSVQNPIVADRNAETVVTVRDGMTLVIGGLYAISEIDDRSGVPILGDIPVIKYLFSRTRKTKVKSELDFFITPFIVKHRLDSGVFVPPGEKGRLARIKARAEGREVATEKDRAARETDDERDPAGK
ncbi:MAG: type II secretion system protein GspD [Planctomycetota bacterium]|jgi:type II secretory pathway component GspD/PulD (secretin)